MLRGKWATGLILTVFCLVLGLLLAVRLRAPNEAPQAIPSGDWDYAIVDLIDNNARLRDEIEDLEAQLAQLDQAGGSTAVLESLVDEANHLRVVNGLVEVSGPGVEVETSGPVTILDLHDLINELRNAGAEALALNRLRLVAWSSISTDGVQVIVDSQPIQSPYRLEAIGDPASLQTALLRPGGLVELLERLDQRITITVQIRDKVTLAVYDQPVVLVYAKPAE